VLYMTSGSLTYISEGIHTTVGNWLLTVNTLCVAGICPFVGYLTDLLGRRNITIFGSLLLIIASVVIATSQSLGSAVTSMAIGGVGAGICELTAIAG
jgi:MFS family permease